MSFLFLALGSVAWAGPTDAAPRFAAGEGVGWAAWGPAGSARRLVGPAIPVGPVRSAAEAEAAVRALLRRNPGLAGVPLDELHRRAVRHHARTDTWYVSLERRIDGVQLLREAVTARIRDGRVVLLGFDAEPAVRALAAPRLDAAAAARVAGGRPDGARRVVLPGGTAAWEVRGGAGRTRWLARVDAATGRVLSREPEVRSLTGTLTATHDTRWPNGETTTSPLPGATLSGSGGTVAYTDELGAYTLPDDEAFTATLTGPGFRLTNEAGAEASLAVTDGAADFTDAATPAERAVWVFLHRARAFGLRFGPDLSLTTTQLRAKVNVDMPCVALYDGALEFGVEGSGCNNLGRIADVAYHEWGHALHDAAVLVGAVDRTLGEGVADTVSALLTLDPTVAPGFYTDGSHLREMATDRVYPDDLTGNIYTDGLVYAGAAWDLLGLLQARYGEGPDEQGTAWAVASSLLFGALAGGPDLETVYAEYVLADDDDGDLGNGTPHLCEITAAFGAHGLGPRDDPFPAVVTHTPLGNQDPGVSAAVSAAVRSEAPGCVDAAPSAVEVRWSTDGESWSAAPLAEADGAWTGALPAFEDGTVVRYRVVAVGPGGEEVAAPAGEPHTFYVGPLTPIACFPFDGDDGGFTHAALDGSGSLADDWAFGPPAGAGDDPAAAYTGADVWGNDLGAAEGSYAPNIRNALTSPEVTAPGGRLVVQYRRWLALADGDTARLRVGETELWATTGTTDGEWVLHTLALDVAGPVALTWELASGETTGAGGWTLDDVCFSAPGGATDTGDTAETGLPDETGETGADDTAGPPGDTGDTDGDGCGCGGGGGLVPLLLAPALLRRRRR